MYMQLILRIQYMYIPYIFKSIQLLLYQWNSPVLFLKQNMFYRQYQISHLRHTISEPTIKTQSIHTDLSLHVNVGPHTF